tara:strand:- start:54 stop:233 length:180 start_codon:yes stop_codon:yes gene_type:complete
MEIKNAKYIVTKDAKGDVKVGVRAELEGIITNVPMDEDNRHYQAILQWVAEGNTIEEAG